MIPPHPLIRNLLQAQEFADYLARQRRKPLVMPSDQFERKPLILRGSKKFRPKTLETQEHLK